MLMYCACEMQEQQGDLKAAQMAKLDAVIAAADLQPSNHVLEIGCGWGSFAMRAASTRGCRCAAAAAAQAVSASFAC
jgi:cyclopropane-fatty-acyl-phospholipid synthase